MKAIISTFELIVNVNVILGNFTLHKSKNKMNRAFIILIVLMISTHIQAQIFNPDPQGLEFFNKGSELIKTGDYYSADSILTLALCSYKNENVYFNRGISRLLLKDTIGFCEDMDAAANKYFDAQAEQLFNKTCCKQVDTIYFDKKLQISNKDKYRYYEIIKVFKYDSVTKGTFHDIKHSEGIMSVDFGCNDSFLGARSKQSDIIAIYVIDEKGKNYIKTQKPISIINYTAYEHLMKQAKTLLESRYGYLKKESDSEKLEVYFSIYFDKEGEITSVEFLGIYPELNIDYDEDTLEADLLHIAKHYPKIKPAKFFKQKVQFIAIDYVEF